MGTKKIKKQKSYFNKQDFNVENGQLSEDEKLFILKKIPATPKTPLVKSDIKLTIGMLVSNRIQYIRKAMEALKPLLDAVPSELIVVDTKGEESDGSIDIVREYTDKIYRFEWCNDFSAARNVCFEHARGEWFLYVDDDEWFDDVTEFIEFFNSDECEKYNGGNYYTRDYDDDGTYSTGVAGRMIRRREDTCFVGRVHETFNEIYPPVKQFSCFTHHYGYAFKSEEEAQKHQDRNLSILKKELVTYGAVPRLCAQMVQELVFLPKTRDAGYNFAIDALNKIEARQELHDACAQWVMLSTVRYFSKTMNLEGAKKQLKWLESKYEMNLITRLCIAGVIANLASATWALEDMLKYAKDYLRLLELKEQYEDEIGDMVNLDMPNYYAEPFYHQMLHVAAAAANRLGLYAEAKSYIDRFPWDRPGFDGGKYIREQKTALEGLEKLEREKKEKISGQTGQVRMPVVKQRKKTEETRLVVSDIKLTIGMLVSNHVQYIRKSMEALKPLLDAVPSELIVVDTKGAESDGSIDIVREYTDKIYSFTWCNDFSAARNVCLEHARGEWFLYVDDDEWFDDVQEFIDFFNSKERDEYHFGYYYTKDYLPDNTYSIGTAGRIIRRTNNTHFVGRIHETFHETYLPAKQFSCFTHHYGYYYETEEASAAKQKRNMDILSEEIQDKGLNPQRAAQMVQELLCRKATAAEGYRLSMEYLPKLEAMNVLKDSCSQWLMAASVRYFSDLKDHEALLEQAKLIQKAYPLTEVAQMVLAATVAFSAAEAGDYETVEEYVALYLKNWDWKLAHEEEAMLQAQLDFPRFYSEAYYVQVLRIAAQAANYQGKYDLANKYWLRMPWKQEGFDASPFQRDLNITIRGMQAQKDKQHDEKVAELQPMVEILSEAGKQLKTSYETQNVSLASQYLVSMQEIAISIGTSLDALIGEGSTTVKLLEQYCELLWNCNNAKTFEEAVALAAILCEAAGLIAENFARETYRKKTVLLFPKRGAEWYLFEPYWQEAVQNGDHVYVIPVPCYEKMYDGTKGPVLYEDEKYPDEVTITSYEKYNYEGKLADLIVLKDDYNEEQTFYTVHPFFYIANMQQYAKDTIVVQEWDGGVSELSAQMRKLREMLDEARQ